MSNEMKDWLADTASEAEYERTHPVTSDTPICKRCKRKMKYLCGKTRMFYECSFCDTRVYVVAEQ